VVGVVLVVDVLEDDAGRRGTMETEKVCPLVVAVLTTGVPVVTLAEELPSNSE
jgi:hypothetical protein